MHGLIITNQELGHNKYKVKRFNEEFFKLGVSLDVLKNDGSLAIIKNNSIEFSFPKYDFVIYLDKDIYLAKELEKNGYRLFNRADFIKLCDDKMLTNIACSNAGIKMPKTIGGPLFYSNEIKEENLTFLDKVISELGLPLILKRVYGSLGEGVHLIHSKEELIKVYSEYCRQPLQFQEYIPTSYGRSIRVLVMDEEVVGAFVRYNADDFRSNFGNTATSKKLENCGRYYDFASKIAKLLKIEYAGIDLLFGEDEEPILCEINSNAFFEEFEKVTGINVAEKFAKMVISKVGK
ncbi:MAG: RimK family alpha-L-glutamate ligase [Bacilli bacterium]|nr:RimK family alpha-L-glutamate ligase [Bacilli bacterium]